MMMTWYLDRKSYLRCLRCDGDLWLGDATVLMLMGDCVRRVAMTALANRN